MVWTRTWLAISLGLGLGACGDDGNSQDPTETATSGGDATASDGADDADADSGGPDDCILGQLGCSCLNDQCEGSTHCVENECVMGPLIDLGEDRAVIGGVIVPHEVDVDADEFTFSQVEGPPVELLSTTAQSLTLSIPADATPGETVTIQVEASRNGVTLSEFWDLRVLPAEFENALPDIADPMQLGTTEGLAFGPEGMYIVSTEGFVSLFNTNGEFVQSYDVGGMPIGASRSGERLFVANAGLGAVQEINLVTGDIGVYFDTLMGGGGLGAVNFLLRDGNGGDNDDNIYISTREDQNLLFYDGVTGSTSVSLNDPALVNPNALAFGPEGNAIYIGTVGHVWRVPLIDGGGTGEPEDFLDLGDDTGITFEVDGLTFDEGQNLWVGCPNAGALFIAHYSAEGPGTISRRFDTPAAGLSGFVNLRFGNGDFDGQSLYYTNLGDGTVGRLRVGLGSL